MSAFSRSRVSDLCEKILVRRSSDGRLFIICNARWLDFYLFANFDRKVCYEVLWNSNFHKRNFMQITKITSKCNPPLRQIFKYIFSENSTVTLNFFQLSWKKFPNTESNKKKKNSPGRLTVIKKDPYNFQGCTIDCRVEISHCFSWMKANLS